MRKAGIGHLLLGMLIGLSACGGGDGTAEPKPEPAVLTSIAVSLGNQSIASGASTQGTANGVDQRGQPMSLSTVSWISSNSTVATVSALGIVTGVRIGQATITASSGGVSASTAITVMAGVAAQLVLGRPAATAMNGRTMGVQPVVEVRDAAGNIAAPESVSPVTVSVSAGTEIEGTTTRPPVGGVVVFSGLALRGQTGSTATLSFRSGTLPPVTQTIAILPFSFGNGTHLVGADIPPGRYRSTNLASASCYWARLRNLTGRDDIIANDIGPGPRLMEVLATDVAIESSGCGPWTEVTGAVTGSPVAPFTDGVYLVGVDIQPGTWRSDGSGTSCYWARLGNIRGEDDLIANHFGAAPAVVTVVASDVAFEASRCGTWTRVP